MNYVENQTLTPSLWQGCVSLPFSFCSQLHTSKRCSPSFWLQQACTSLGGAQGQPSFLFVCISFFASSALIFLFYDPQTIHFYEYLIEIRQTERKERKRKKKQEGREGGGQGWGKERKTEISNFLSSPAGCFSFMSLDRLAESVLRLASVLVWQALTEPLPHSRAWIIFILN